MTCIECGGFRKDKRSQKCASCSHKGHSAWNKGMKGFRAGEIRRPRTEEERALISKNRKGKQVESDHPAWKADNVGYRALHEWVDSRKGKPMECSNCGDTTSHRYHWANLSREYKRDINDWIRLCPKCHKGYDVRKEALTYQTLI